MTARAVWLGDTLATSWTCDLMLHWRIQAERAWDTRVDGFRAAFKAIDKNALAGRPELLTYGYLEQAIGSEVERRVCRAELWGVDHLNGWQVSLPMYLSRQPVATEVDRKAEVIRLEPGTTKNDEARELDYWLVPELVEAIEAG